MKSALSGETGDAAYLLAHLFTHNQLSAGYNNLSALAAELTGAKEAHHFYPILFYFRFPEPFYAVSRSWLITLDAVSLIRSALPKDADWLKQSGAVVEIWSSGMLLLSTLNSVFLQDQAVDGAAGGDRQFWGVRFDAARRRLQDVSISVKEDLARSRKAYIEHRREWDGLVRSIGDAMAYDPRDIDTLHGGLSLTPRAGDRDAADSARSKRLCGREPKSAPRAESEGWYAFLVRANLRTAF